MRWTTRNHNLGKEAAMRRLTRGISHGRAVLGSRRLATVLGTFALNPAAAADATGHRGADTPPRSWNIDHARRFKSSINLDERTGSVEDNA